MYLVLSLIANKRIYIYIYIHTHKKKEYERWGWGGGAQDNSRTVSVKEDTVCATTSHRLAILLTFQTDGKHFHAISWPTVSSLYQCQKVVLKYVTSRVLWRRGTISDQLFLLPSRCPKKNTRFRRSSPATVPWEGWRGGSRFSRLYIISGALCCANQHLSPPVLAAASQGDQKVKTFDSVLLC